MSDRRRKLGGVLAGLLLMTWAAGAAWADDDAADRAVDWLTYREALARGRDQARPILLQFTAQHSSVGRKMLRETYGNTQVIRYLNRNFAVAMIDIGKLPSLARKYRIESVPEVWFLDETGRALTSINGEVGPQKLLRVAEYIVGKFYEHVDYDTWLSKRKSR